MGWGSVWIVGYLNHGNRLKAGRGDEVSVHLRKRNEDARRMMDIKDQGRRSCADVI